MIFLKLGGSLITDKAEPLTARSDVIKRLAAEIAAAWRASSDMSLLIGHGSGSFGHHAASQSGTHLGAHSAGDWSGFVSVAFAARQLHQLVMQELVTAGLPAISFPPSSMLLAHERQILSYHIAPIARALDHGLLPVVHGDVAFDDTQGSAIISTEQLFSALAGEFHPARLLLAGLQPGVLGPDGETLAAITGGDYEQLQFNQVPGEDVTGGMQAKVKQALQWAARFPAAEILIFSAEQPGTLQDVLGGSSAGTRVLP